MLKPFITRLNSIIPARIRAILIGSAGISFLKILSSFALLSLLSSASEGTLTYYGTLQNSITILAAVIGMSVQNGITTHTAKMDINQSFSDIASHLGSVLIIGSCIAGLLGSLLIIVDFDFTAILGFSNDRTLSLLVCIALLAVMHRYYASILFGRGFILAGQSLDLLRNLVALLAALLWVYTYSSFDLIWIILLSNLVAIPFVIRKSSRFFARESSIRLRFDFATWRIVKAGLITGYSGILFAVVSLLIRDQAVEVGGYVLSDSWELLLRFVIIYQLLVTAPLSQILLRSYASGDLTKPLQFFFKALPFGASLLLVILLIPEDFMARVLHMAFGQEISNLKVIFLLLIGSEILRTLGMFCHNMLVSQALIFPQAVFETIAQSIVLLAVFFFVAENFILLYFSALFASMVFWAVSNFLYVVYLSKQNGS